MPHAADSSDPSEDKQPAQTLGGELPQSVRARFNGELDGQNVVAWSEFDLDGAGQFRPQHLVLTDSSLFIISDQAVQRIPIRHIAEATIIEGLGADRMRLVVDGQVAATIRYSRRHRREVTRLHRKLERRLPTDGEAEPRPEWLETVEREIEQQEYCRKCGQFIPAYAEGVCPQCLQNRRVLWRLLDTARPYRVWVWVALTLTLATSGIMTIPPLLLRSLFDRAIAPQADGTEVYMPADQRIYNLFFFAGIYLLTVLVLEGINFFRLRLLTMIGTSVARDLRHQVYSHLHELSLRFFGKRRTGSLITRVTSDTDRLWDFIVFGSVSIIRDLLLILVIAAVMFYLNWRLAVVALLPIPAIAALTYYRSMRMHYMFGRLWGYWSRLTAVVGDALPGVRVVKAFANEPREVRRFDDRNREYTVREQEVNKVWAGLQPAVSGMMRLGVLLVWVMGGYLVITDPGGRNTYGTLLAFTAYVMQFYQPIMELASANRVITRAATSAQRVFEVLDTPPEIYSRQGAITKDRLEGRVEFRDVSFSYEGAQPALREVSMVAEPGEMIGLCGASGAGKSTFVNLICRFYDPTDGQILIDGIDVRDYDVRWLRRQIGVVLQEPYLFHGTIAENIRYGAPEATEQQVIAAARAANAHDFIVGFPDGYDTMVGERGQSLSGGERQRISIARAILHNPRILILDEATSSVDTETEKQIQQALDRLVAGRTTFAIAHRLSTLTAADRLIVLDKGRIVEQGTHSELVHLENGVYAKLHKTQVEMSSLVAIQ